jgi:putative colanic acid biosynthesis acetyltransferase WcaF
MTGPIVIEQGAFVFAEAFVGMDVTIGQEAVVAARAVVVKDVMASTIVAGNPARVIGERFIANADSRTEGDKGDLLT